MRPIPNMARYFADECGFIYSTQPWGRTKKEVVPRRLKPHLSGSGYPMVVLYVGGEKLDKLVHRLVLETFVGPCPTGMEACHGDGNKLNPALSNLRWDTPKNNGRDKVKHGTNCNGETHGAAKLNATQVRVARRYCEMFGLGAQTEIANIFNVGQPNISMLVHKKTWQSQ